MTEVSPHYLGERGDAYHDKVKDTHRFNAETAMRILRPHLRPGDTVLDFGCADGALLDALPSNAKVGVEVNSVSRAEAIQRGLTVYDSTRVLDDASIDFVISSHVLEHTLQPLDELVELHRVLNPEGRLLLILPMDDWRVQRRWTLPEQNHHLYTWSPQLLANLLSEAGFTVESVDVLTYALPGRLTKRLHDVLPSWLFDVVARGTAIARRRRQLIALARLPTDSHSSETGRRDGS